MFAFDPQILAEPRFAALSNEARLLWPWLLLAAGDSGEFPYDCQWIRQRAFRNFTDPPTDELILTVLFEYGLCEMYEMFYRDGHWCRWNPALYSIARDFEGSYQ